MSGDSDDLDKLIERVADGQSVDWDELERAAPDEDSRRIVRQLRLIAEVGEVYRSRVDNVALAEEAATAPAVPGVADLVATPESERRRIWPQVGDKPGPSDVVWGHLRLVRKIGEGSFGEVFHAHDTWLDHPVALKLLKREAEARVPASQLLHEARKLARVRHTNVVTVHGADRHNGRVGFWMDYIDGETLASRVNKGRLSAGEAVSVGQEVCRALAAVHQANLIHRDVKAQNVMRASDGGRIILMDFGAGEFIGDPGKRPQGTPLYLAPELLRGGDATVRSDIYAVGVLLYHLVTGRFPVDGHSPAALIEAHERGDRKRLRDERADLPDSFISIVERAIDPDPERRYASAGSMEAKLSGEPATRPIPVTPRPPAPSIGDYAKRAAILAVAVVALTGVLGFIAARFFEVVLHIDRDFWLGPVDTFVIGIRGLFPYVVLWLFGIAVLGVLAAIRTLFGKAVSRPWERLVAVLDAKDPRSVATGIFLFGAAAWVVLNLVVHREMFTTLYALQEDPLNPSLDLSILGPARNGVRVWHLLLSAYLSMLLGLAVWRWFPRLEERTKVPSTVGLLKWGTVAVAFIVVAWDVMPRRILWEQHPRARFENRLSLVIASTGEDPGDEMLLYFPDEPGRPSLREQRDEVTYLGGSRSLFGIVGAR